MGAEGGIRLDGEIDEPEEDEDKIRIVTYEEKNSKGNAIIMVFLLGIAVGLFSGLLIGGLFI